MAERFLISVDLKNLNEGLDLKTISYLSRLYITILPETYEEALLFVRRNCGLFTIYCDCCAIKDVEHIASILNAGTTRVFVHETTLDELLKKQTVPKEGLKRLAIRFGWSGHGLDNERPDEAIKTIELYARETQAGLGFSGSPELAEMIMDNLKDMKLRSRFYVQYVPYTEHHFTKLVKDDFVAIVPASCLTVDLVERKFPVHNFITDLLHSDRSDGLFPTVVTDERGTCLGLVYSNRESVKQALRTGQGVYYSRSRKGLWVKGEESGNTQELVSISLDCDADALQFKVRQKGEGNIHLHFPCLNTYLMTYQAGFCHLQTATCFGESSGISRLEHTLKERKVSAPTGSYTARLFDDSKLLQAKIMEEANELCEATDKNDVAAEAADLLYFALTKCVAAGVSFKDIENNLDWKSLQITRRKGDAKSRWTEKVGSSNVDNGPHGAVNGTAGGYPDAQTLKEAASVPKAQEDPAGLMNGRIQMRRYKTAETTPETINDTLQRPSQRATDDIMNIVKPIIKDIHEGGDAAVLKYTHKFERATSLKSPVLKAPFPEHLMQLSPETIHAIDVSYNNIRRFHAAQKEDKPLEVETMPGVVCTRFSRPIEKVGLYVPGGTAVLPSTALMLGVPAMVAGCKTIVLASPPRSDGTITPEIVYVAHKVGAESIVLAGGAQAVAALAYGTESISKVDKILGPGNQFVTAGKMIVSNDTTAGVSIDMPAGPSEVLVIADKTANPAFVASDLLSQAEHGTDSQVVLIAVDLSEKELAAIEGELHAQANALPRVDIVRGAIEHSVTLVVKDIEEAMKYSNQYAPEHLILQVANAEGVVQLVENAGSVFVGPWTPESVGDYSAGVNHSLRKSTLSGVGICAHRCDSSSNLWLREAVLWGQSLFLYEAYHKLESHPGGIEKCRRSGHAIS